MEISTSTPSFWLRRSGPPPQSADALLNPQFIRLDGNPNEAMVLMQKVDHPSRVHVDIETDNKDAEVERLIALGATVVERMERWVVLEAPSGHRFCVIGPIRNDFAENANVWE
ncbi:MAG: VOC family protein [Pseudomonadota bacterium]